MTFRQLKILTELSTKHYLPFLILPLFYLTCIYNIDVAYAPNQDYQQSTVSVNNYTLTADLALTSEQITKGLAVKDTLKENEGMLFVFDNPSKQHFWMMDMKFPIDIIWLNENKEIVHIEENLEPCRTTCPSFPPDEESKYVLETVAGFADKHNLKERDNVFFELPQLPS